MPYFDRNLQFNENKYYNWEILVLKHQKVGSHVELAMPILAYFMIFRILESFTKMLTLFNCRNCTII